MVNLEDLRINLNYKNVFVVPVAFHNFSNYDSHFIITSLLRSGNVSVLPINKEKYISLTYQKIDSKIKFRFIDSYRFLSASLEELAGTLNFNEFHILHKENVNLDIESLKLITKKGVFPYDYVSNLEKLNDTQLPAIQDFYNQLNDSHITEEMYTHAQNVWYKFDIKTLGEYSDLYMRTDVLLLADIMEKFRKTSMKTYKLDPLHYYTLPGFSWSAMLKFSRCKLRILKDIDIIMFIEKAIRGGISVCSGRYSEANNKYMKDYDSSQPSKYILYVDVNNLYGKAMSDYLPLDQFEWVHNVESIDVMQISDDSEYGYILEVDLKIPIQLHDFMKDYPFLPQHQAPPNSKNRKLMTTLYDKKNYILHYRNLKQALTYGVELTKIHKLLRFRQTPWLKPYIDLNTSLRMQAKSTFEKNLFKLMNNSIFGKTMENIRLHRRVKLVRNYNGRYGAKNLISSPFFSSSRILDTDLLAIELKKSKLVFNKPLYVGMSILDISKTYMYHFHYNFMQKNLRNQFKLLYTDTDSFIYEISCDDVYKNVILSHLDQFDTSDYPADNEYGIPLVNKKVPGLMKDESNGKLITKYAALRSKMYAYKVQSGKVVKKSKGVKYNVVKNKITFEDYVECLMENKNKVLPQNTIRSFGHNVYTINQSKIALNPHDDKRQLIPGSFDTLPWGYKNAM